MFDILLTLCTGSVYTGLVICKVKIIYSNRIFMLIGLSSLKSQFTNLCKFAVVKLAVLKFAVKSSIYKPM